MTPEERARWDAFIANVNYANPELPVAPLLSFPARKRNRLLQRENELHLAEADEVRWAKRAAFWADVDKRRTAPEPHRPRHLKGHPING
jgi:hypothetical protein